jgi:hypothetical protein
MGGPCLNAGEQQVDDALAGLDRVQVSDRALGHARQDRGDEHLGGEVHVEVGHSETPLGLRVNRPGPRAVLSAAVLGVQAVIDTKTGRRDHP